MDHSVASRQLTPMLTGGSKYQAMPLGASQDAMSAPIRAPIPIHENTEERDCTVSDIRPSLCHRKYP